MKLRLNHKATTICSKISLKTSSEAVEDDKQEKKSLGSALQIQGDIKP